VFDDIGYAVQQVLASPVRLAFLLDEGPYVAVNLMRFIRRIVPHASRELEKIRTLAEVIPDVRLRREAIASIEGKSYHVAGACILATFLPREAARHYVEIVTPLETIYDYLDNLCDRHPEVSSDAYPVLHRAIADALNPHAKPAHYYARGPVGDDGEYLRTLVLRTQRALRRLAGHELLVPYFREAAALYSEMQTYKHLPAGERERACIDWYTRNQTRFADLDWYEFASAAGSQFQVYAPLFMLFAAEPHAIGAAYDAYFPAIAAMHVLLDAFIDQAEDREHGELNFVASYNGKHTFSERFAWLAANAKERFDALPSPRRHRFVLRVMTLFYLTHPKVFRQGLNPQAQRLLKAIR
jgi:tetraprenyl-beta-curcumene synthase